MNFRTIRFVLLALLAFGLLGARQPTSRHSRPAPPDECEDFRRAIAALPARGGQVDVPAGNYVCKQPIIIDRDNVILAGQGSSQTHLRADPNSPVPLIIVGTVTSRASGSNKVPYPQHVTRGVTVRGFDLDGGWQGRPGEVNHQECWDPGTNELKSCKGDGGWLVRVNGVTVRAGEDITLDDIQAHGQLSGGIVVEKRSQNVHISTTALFGNYYDGFAGYETVGAVIENFQVHDNGYSGISLDANFSQATFRQGEVFNNGDNGIFVANSPANHFEKLNLRHNRRYGILITSTGSSCDDNKISDSTIVMDIRDSDEGLRLGAVCQNVEVDHVHVVHPRRRCQSAVAGASFHMNHFTCSRH